MTPLLLKATEYGAGLPLAILHGLFGSGRNWASIATRLGERHRVVAFDLRNHGASPWAETMDYAGMADDVRASLAALGHRRFALLGHSMGGKVAMLAALRDPDSVERLVVADIAPVAYEPRHLGMVRAMRGLDLAGFRRRSEADALLEPAVPDPAERAFLLQNLVLDGGTARWRINLAAIEREMPVLVGFPPIPAGVTYDGPALFIGGGRSDYLRPEHDREIRRLFPQARIARIAEAGHWLHAERPRAFLERVEGFLAG
ncbi:MAG: alpha/beta fold hydrolase [Alphaproteobacteria bacterium]